MSPDAHTLDAFCPLADAGAENPTYTKKGSTDYAINIVGGIIVTTGLIKFGVGLYNMSFGTNVLDIE